MPTPPPKLSFKEQMHQAREEAILQAACRLLGEKAYDTMTMDDVANEVGIAKASLYKHFASKEELCCAAMVQILGRVQHCLDAMPAEQAPREKLRALVRWSLERLIANEMSPLPGRASALRHVLLADERYAAALMGISDRIGQWITQAQADGSIDPGLPPLVVLSTLYARACDPVVGFLQDSGQFSDEAIVALVLQTCFDGLRPPG